MSERWRKAKLVANLNAIWQDIDYHDAPDPHAAAEIGIAKISEIVESGAIPQPTFYVRSGRGFWVFRRIRDLDARALSLHKHNVRLLTRGWRD